MNKRGLGKATIILIVLIVLIIASGYYFSMTSQFSPLVLSQKTAGKDYVDPKLANVLSDPTTRLEPMGDIKIIRWRDKVGSYKIEQRDYRIVGSSKGVTGRVISNNGQIASLTCTASCTGNNCHPSGCVPQQTGSCDGCICLGGATPTSCSQCTCSKTVTENSYGE